MADEAQLVGGGLDATWIYPKLWMGSRPAVGPRVADAGFGTLVLAEAEFQPQAVNFPGLRSVIHCPLDDCDPITQNVIHKARACAQQLADLVGNRRRRTLVACHMGLNRSGLIVGLTLVELGVSGASALARIQMLRSGALSNPAFAAYLGGRL